MTRRALARAALAALLGVGLAAGAAGEELPAWPHEQQQMLRQVEEELLVVQRKLYKARLTQDPVALERESARFRDLQDRRQKLIDLTRYQLPSE